MTIEKKCLTKVEITNSLIDKLNLDKPVAASLVEKYIELLKDALATDGRVMLSGFGSYEVNFKEARRGRNPQTGEAMTLRPRRIVKFKPSQILRKALNGEEI